MARSNSSMQLTRAADYAIRVMIHMATLPEGTRALLTELARVTETPESFLSKILQALTRAKLVVSQRGKSGGFELLASGRAASMYDVIEAIDGPIHLNRCLTSGQSCDRSAWCPAHPVWARAQQAMLEVLKGALVLELAGKNIQPQIARSAVPTLLVLQQ